MTSDLTAHLVPNRWPQARNFSAHLFLYCKRSLPSGKTETSKNRFKRSGFSGFGGQNPKSKMSTSTPRPNCQGTRSVKAGKWDAFTFAGSFFKPHLAMSDFGGSKLESLKKTKEGVRQKIWNYQLGILMLIECLFRSTMELGIRKIDGQYMGMGQNPGTLLFTPKSLVNSNGC